ncbi:MAG: ATP synthase subunit alpha [candidate division TM6 bacterium GW2011_GWF2_30_66]|jgi:F-type H+-transporting ATPase subunit alpha|nr:MAG: ATP synthase subunit alpha [candidate division TM6 bacterium GW2011_GWF2_30_66]
MEIKNTDLVSLFEQSLKDVPQEKLEEIGIVVKVGDNICQVHGLTNAEYNELIEFEGGNKGIIFNLDEESVDVFLLDNNISVAELEIAKRTGSVLKTPVGKNFLGRVINALGKPIDALGEIIPDSYEPIEAAVPSIIERSPVNQSLETGILAIDALIPIGKGQRELIIGNRSTGKSAIAIDTILHQKNQNVICIYVSIGLRQANLAKTVKLLEENGALNYTVIISADSGEAVLNQYLAPYVGCTIGEYFMHQGKDVLIIYDDLSNHAIAFREMSLLLRRAPGREAYPGDVFYLHSRLLERAGKLLNGGSLTALPIIQTQSDDISAYIPTNLISITDGQIILDTQLFNQGIRPAINVELSVSRVGGAAQTKAIKKVTKALRLELAQYHELLDFSQFGTELDESSQKQLKRGSFAVEILKQPQFRTYSFVDQCLILFALKENYLDNLQLKNVQSFIVQFTSYVKSVYPNIYKKIYETQDISDDTMHNLKEIANEFKRIFVPEDQI